jgi:hypothetical protein
MVYPAAPGLVVVVAMETEMPALMAVMAQHSVQEACLPVPTVAQAALAVELAVVMFGVAVAVAPVTSVDKAVIAGLTIVLAPIMVPAEKVARVMSSVKPRTCKIAPVMVVPVDTPPTEATDTSIFPSTASKYQLVAREMLVACTTLTPCAVSLYPASE